MPHRYRESPNTEEEARRRSKLVLFRLGMLAVFAVVFAALAPGPLFPAALQVMLFITAIGSAVTAVLLREPPLSPHLTHTDQAALLLLAALVAGWFIDPAAIEQHLEGVDD